MIQSKIQTRRGSALLLTLMVVSLLLILVLSFVAFVRLQLREVTNQQNLRIARQNATVGLQIAISQLQKYAGADQRITAPATTVYPAKDFNELYDADGDMGTSPMWEWYREAASTSNARSYLDQVETYLTPDERQQWDLRIRDWWNNSGNARNPHWVAVYDSSLRVDRTTDPSAPPTNLSPQRYELDSSTTYGEPKRDQPPVWLISGNEQFNFDPQTDTAYPGGYYTPDTPLPDPDTDNSVVWLVGDGSATGPSLSSDGLEGRVKAPKQTLGLNHLKQEGYYAYWVGDESTKANFSVQSPDPATVSTQEYRNYLQAPQRIGWERMSEFESMGLNPYAPVFSKVITHNQIALLDPATLGDDPNTSQNESVVAHHFHDITSYSESLITDTALGGLKKDLTRFLEDGTGLDPDDPIPDATLYDAQDPRFKAWHGSNSGFPVDGSADGIPTWGQIRYWYQNTGGGSGEITPNAETAPMLTYIMLNTGMSYDPDTKQLHWHWTPAVVLWNPYDVPLKNATYELEVQVSPSVYQFSVVKTNPSLAELQQDVGAEWAMRPIGPETFPGSGVNQSVVSFRSPMVNPETGTQYWPIIKPDNHSYYTYNGTSNSPDAYNIGGRGPFTWDNTFADGTTDGFGRYHYNLRSIPAMVGRIRDPFNNRSPSNDSADPSTFSDTGSVLGEKNWGDLRFAPMNPATDNTNPKPYATILRFRITSNFDAGESLIFSLADPVAWDPIVGSAVDLQPGFEAEFPGTIHFPVLDVINGPDSASGLRFWANLYLSSNRLAPEIRLTLAGEIIQQANSFAGDASHNTFAMGTKMARFGSFMTDEDADGDGIVNSGEVPPAFVDRWRPVYALDDFHNHIQPYVTDTGNQDSAIWDGGQHYLTPLTASGDGSIADIFSNTPAFSRFNINAKEGDVHPLLDRIRDRWGTNNRAAGGVVEGMSKIDFYNSYSKASTPKWDNDQYNNLKGYSLINYRNRSTETYAGLSILPIRLSRRPDSTILSLGQFQQVNLSPYSWEPAFPIGNSWAGVYVDREAIAGIHSRMPGLGGGWAGGSAPRPPQVIPNSMSFTLTGANTWGAPLEPVEVPANSMLDLSYVLNEGIWDRYFLSTIPSSPDITRRLSNSRHQFTATALSAGAELTSFDDAAAHLTNHGALNVNSTSVEAWKALLTAFRDLRLGDNPADTVPVARSLDPIGDSIAFTFSGISNTDIAATGGPKDYTKLLNGFRYLDDDMIQALAERIVDEVRLRGPFYSLSDFVNRRLNPPQGSGQSGSDWTLARTIGWHPGSPHAGDNRFMDFMNPTYQPFIGLQGLSGPLQRAIDLSGINGGVNHPDFGDDGSGSGNNNDMVFTPRIRNSTNGAYDERNSSFNSGVGNNSNLRDKHTHEPTKRGHVDVEHYAGAPAGEAGFLFQGVPGFITQGDLLAMLGPALTPRGDTFIVRAYGDCSQGNTINARAWLEAVVQRTVEPIQKDSTDPHRPTSSFGRRYKVISVRWLSPEEI